MEAALTPPTHHPRLERDDLLQPFLHALTPQSMWRVGTEAEKFGILTDSNAPLPYDGPRSVSAVLNALSERFGWFQEPEYEGGPVIALVRGQASITLEPGGQLELSGAPFESLHETKSEWLGHLAELHAVSDALGIAWLGLGFHPFAKQSELPWVPKLRYGVMKEYLPTRGRGGLDMMQRTCTVQANLDYSSEADAMQKLRIALALSPIVTAMFANSPLVEGRLTGEQSHRAWVWLNMDPDRSGLLPFAWDRSMSFERYVEWALDAPMFLVKRSDKVVRNTGQTFRAFMHDGFGGAEANYADWVTHLGTLFPEVRLKRTIELRGGDSLGTDLVPTLPALWKGLLYDDQARSKAESLASQIAFDDAQTARNELVRLGLGAKLVGRPLLEWATELLTIAHAGLQRLNVQNQAGKDESSLLAPLEHLIERGQTPASLLASSLDPSQELAPQVIRLSRL